MNEKLFRHLWLLLTYLGFDRGIEIKNHPNIDIRNFLTEFWLENDDNITEEVINLIISAFKLSDCYNADALKEDGVRGNELLMAINLFLREINQEPLETLFSSETDNELKEDFEDAN